MFAVGDYFPPVDHAPRLARYRENKKLFLGQHYDVFERVQKQLSASQREIIYTSANLAGLICKKSADFLFGENPVYSAGTDDNSAEQKALERLAADNDLHITNYETALGSAYRGDSFYKIRYGQEYEGAIPPELDPFRVFIESQNAAYVFPEVNPTDATSIMAYHIAYPVPFEDGRPVGIMEALLDKSVGEVWYLFIESHYPGRIVYRQMKMIPARSEVDGVVVDWKIYEEVEGFAHEVATGVPIPLVVHVPNYSTDDTWEGIDDLTELKPLFDELNNRLSLIATILDKHSDPAMVVPAGSMEDGEDGRPVFHVQRDKVFEVMGKDEIIPQYVTWDGQLLAAFESVKNTLDLILTIAEIPPVALGKDNSGTSGASGLSIKWRMNSLLSKINRKRQYFDRALRKVFFVAQLLEHSRANKPDYKVTPVRIKFKDGLPDDELEQAQIYSLRLAGKATISQKTAIMAMDGLTEEQADKELERIQEEEAALEPVDGSVFNKTK